MCSELKPCPFEKPGEKHHIEAIETRPGYGYIYCFDCEFAFPGEEELSADVLADRWNTRAEREVGISKFQKITGTSYIEAKSIITSLKQAGAKVVE